MSDSMHAAARRAALLRAQRDGVAQEQAVDAPAVDQPAGPSNGTPPVKQKPAKTPPPKAPPTKAPKTPTRAPKKPSADTPAEPAKSRIPKIKAPKIRAPKFKKSEPDAKTPEQTPQPAVVTTPKKKGWKYLLGLAIRIGVFAGAVVIVLVAVDFGAGAVIENKISQQAHTAMRLHDDPSVTVHGWPIDVYGFPFMNQALTGSYDHISIQADGVAASKKLRNVEEDVELHDVHADIGDVYEGNTSKFSIPRATSAIHVKQSDLGRLLGLPNLYIEPASSAAVAKGDYAAADKATSGKASKTAGIKLRGSVGKTDVVEYALVHLSGRSVHVEPRHAQTVDGKKLPADVESKALTQTAKTIKIPKLPFGAHASTVSVDSGAVVVQGSVKNPRFGN